MNDCLTRTETIGSAAKLDKFAYDLDDQVTEARYNFHDETQDRLCSYDYDPAGNRNTMTDTVNGQTNYAVNNLNQYTAAGGDAPQYDLNGNLTHQGLWTYVYDAQNRLVSASSPSQQVDFAYDPRNRCVRRTSSTPGGIQGPTMAFYYDGWDLIEEYSGGVLLARYVHGVREDEMIAKIDSYGTVYYHTDAEGSVVALTNTSGTVIERYKYDAFGAPTILDPSLVTRPSSLFGNRFLFTGREWLPDLGLYDYRNRVYSSELGRFLQSDPKSFDADPSNLYRYCGNDPLDRVDPMGLEYKDLYAQDVIDNGYGENAQRFNMQKNMRRTGQDLYGSIDTSIATNVKTVGTSLVLSQFDVTMGKRNIATSTRFWGDRKEAAILATKEHEDKHAVQAEALHDEFQKRLGTVVGHLRKGEDLQHAGERIWRKLSDEFNAKQELHQPKGEWRDILKREDDGNTRRSMVSNQFDRQMQPNRQFEHAGTLYFIQIIH